MPTDVRYVCSKCAHKSIRRADSKETDFNCPECGQGRLVRVNNPKEELKFKKAKEEIKRMHGNL